jgi:CRISPR-associated protein Cas2
MLYIICYDIVDDKRRRKIDKLLKGLGTRVQKSVFEARLDTKKLVRLKNRASAIIEHEEDNIRIYRQCASCLSVVEIMGSSPQIEETQKLIVV